MSEVDFNKLWNERTELSQKLRDSVKELIASSTLCVQDRIAVISQVLSELARDCADDSSIQAMIMEKQRSSIFTGDTPEN